MHKRFLALTLSAVMVLTSMSPFAYGQLAPTNPEVPPTPTVVEAAPVPEPASIPIPVSAPVSTPVSDPTPTPTPTLVPAAPLLEVTPQVFYGMPEIVSGKVTNTLPAIIEVANVPAGASCSLTYRDPITYQDIKLEGTADANKMLSLSIDNLMPYKMIDCSLLINDMGQTMSLSTTLVYSPLEDANAKHSIQQVSILRGFDQEASKEYTYAQVLTNKVISQAEPVQVDIVDLNTSEKRQTGEVKTGANGVANLVIESLSDGLYGLIVSTADMSQMTVIESKDGSIFAPYVMSFSDYRGIEHVFRSEKITQNSSYEVSIQGIQFDSELKIAKISPENLLDQASSKNIEIVMGEQSHDRRIEIKANWEGLPSGIYLTKVCIEGLTFYEVFESKRIIPEMTVSRTLPIIITVNDLQPYQRYEYQLHSVSQNRLSFTTNGNGSATVQIDTAAQGHTNSITIYQNSQSNQSIAWGNYFYNPSVLEMPNHFVYSDGNTRSNNEGTYFNVFSNGDTVPFEVEILRFGYGAVNFEAKKQLGTTLGGYKHINLGVLPDGLYKINVKSDAGTMSYYIIEEKTQGHIFVSSGKTQYSHSIADRKVYISGKIAAVKQDLTFKLKKMDAITGAIDSQDLLNGNYNATFDANIGNQDFISGEVYSDVLQSLNQGMYTFESYYNNAIIGYNIITVQEEIQFDPDEDRIFEKQPATCNFVGQPNTLYHLKRNSASNPFSQYVITDDNGKGSVQFTIPSNFTNYYMDIYKNGEHLGTAEFGNSGFGEYVDVSHIMGESMTTTAQNRVVIVTTQLERDLKVYVDGQLYKNGNSETWKTQKNGALVLNLDFGQGHYGLHEIVLIKAGYEVIEAIKYYDSSKIAVDYASIQSRDDSKSTMDLYFSGINIGKLNLSQVSFQKVSYDAGSKRYVSDGPAILSTQIEKISGSTTNMRVKCTNEKILTNGTYKISFYNDEGAVDTAIIGIYSGNDAGGGGGFDYKLISGYEKGYVTSQTAQVSLEVTNGGSGDIKLFKKDYQDARTLIEKKAISNGKAIFTLSNFDLDNNNYQIEGPNGDIRDFGIYCNVLNPSVDKISNLWNRNNEVYKATIFTSKPNRALNYKFSNEPGVAFTTNEDGVSSFEKRISRNVLGTLVIFDETGILNLSTIKPSDPNTPYVREIQQKSGGVGAKNQVLQLYTHLFTDDLSRYSFKFYKLQFNQDKKDMTYTELNSILKTAVLSKVETDVYSLATAFTEALTEQNYLLEVYEDQQLVGKNYIRLGGQAVEEKSNLTVNLSSQPGGPAIPKAGRTVFLMPHGETQLSKAIARSTTNNQGIAIFANINPGDYTLILEGFSYLGAQYVRAVKDIHVEGIQITTDLLIASKYSAYGSLILNFKKNGQPVAGMHVNLSNTVQGLYRYAMTDSNGQVTFSNLPVSSNPEEGTYQYSATTDYKTFTKGSEKVEVLDQTLNIEVMTTYNFSGIVRKNADNRTVSVPVKLYEQIPNTMDFRLLETIYSNYEQGYAFTGIEKNHLYKIQVDENADTKAYEFVAEGGSDKVINILLEERFPKGEQKIRILDSEGNGVNGATVLLANRQNDKHYSGTTDPQGLLTIDQVAFGLLYDIYVSNSWGTNTRKSLEVELKPGVEQTISLPGSRTISGSIRVPSTLTPGAYGPLANADLYAVGTDGSYISGKSNAQGEYELRVSDLPGTQYDLHLNNLSDVSLSYVINQDNLKNIEVPHNKVIDIYLVKGAGLYGSILDEKGQMFNGDLGNIYVYGGNEKTHAYAQVTKVNGKYEYRVSGALAAGTYSVYSSKTPEGYTYVYGEAVVTEADVAANRSVSLDLKMVPAVKSQSFDSGENHVASSVSQAKRGELVDFKVTYQNTGLTTLNNVKVKAVLPDGLQRTSGILEKNLTTLQPGEKGSFSFAGKVDSDFSGDKLAVSAEIILGTNSYTIGYSVVNVLFGSLDAPGLVKANTAFKVYGEASEGSQVTVVALKDGVEKVLAMAMPNGRWYSAEVTLPDTGEYKLYARISKNGELHKTEMSSVKVETDPLMVSDIEMTSGSISGVGVNEETGIAAFSVWVNSKLEGSLMTVDFALNNVIDTDDLKVKFLGKSYPVTRNTSGGYKATIENWKGSGSEKVILEVGQGEMSVQFTLAEILILIDPSGYVYNFYTGERIEGATVVCEVKDELSGNWSKWQAEKYGQINPQITDEEGKYGWMVPAGTYRVVVQAPDFEVYNTTMAAHLNPASNIANLVIPPARDDVFIGIVDHTVPDALSTTPEDLGEVNLNSDISVVFNKPMDQNALKTAMKIYNISNDVVAGSFSFTDNDQRVVFKPSIALTNNETYRLVVDATASDKADHSGVKRFFAGLSLVFTAKSEAVALSNLELTVTPANGGTGVLVNSLVTVTANQILDKTTIHNGFATENTIYVNSNSNKSLFGVYVKDSTGNLVPGRLNISGAQVVFTPVSLEGGKSYTVVVGSAVKGGDLYVGSEKTYSFTTAPSSANPGNNNPTPSNPGTGSPVITNPPAVGTGTNTVVTQPVTTTTPIAVNLQDEAVSLGAAKDYPSLDVRGLKLMSDGKVYSFKEGSIGIGKVSATLKLTAEQLKNWSALGVYGYDAQSKTWKALGGLVSRKDSTIRFNTAGYNQFAIAHGERSFTDLKGSTNAEKAVLVLASKGLIAGKTADAFKGKDSITRAEIASMLVKAVGLEAKTSVKFSDLGTAWYKEVMEIAGGSGIISGSGGKAMPNNEITREEFAVMLMKTYELIKGEKAPSGSMVSADVAKTSSWAKEAISKMTSLGILKLGSDNVFGPKVKVSREEAAEAIYRLLEMIE